MAGLMKEKPDSGRICPFSFFPPWFKLIVMSFIVNKYIHLARVNVDQLPQKFARLSVTVRNLRHVNL